MPDDYVIENFDFKELTGSDEVTGDLDVSLGRRRHPQRAPHRGFETITYVLAGTVKHGDSLGNHGTIGAGDIQWTTAGRGIIHH